MNTKLSVRSILSMFVHIVFAIIVAFVIQFVFTIVYTVLKSAWTAIRHTLFGYYVLELEVNGKTVRLELTRKQAKQLGMHIEGAL